MARLSFVCRHLVFSVSSWLTSVDIQCLVSCRNVWQLKMKHIAFVLRCGKINLDIGFDVHEGSMISGVTGVHTSYDDDDC